MLSELTASRALLLQGPNGPFFRRFARELEQRGVAVTKVNFNPGDALFFRGPNAISFRGPMSEWPGFFRELVAREGIDAVFLFGDCRPMHRQAVRICGDLGIDVWVFEEGYLRPHHITLEKGGVNGNSSLPKDPGFYRRAAAELPDSPPPLPVGHTFLYTAVYAALNAWACTLFGWRYPHYRHHRDINALRQGALWARGFARKAWYSLRERRVLDRVQGSWDGRYFFVPLQVHCDAQIGHSPFASVESFIEEVVTEFARHAPGDTLLILKHHPQDRAYRDHGRLIRRLADRHGCAGRIVYVHDLHLPTLLRHARGTVCMNSTVGLSSLHHGTPVKVLGTAVYDIPGLTARCALGDFFHDPGDVDAELYDAFCRWLREANQVNGSFHKRLPGVRTASGLRWPQPRNTSDSSDDSWSQPMERSA